MTGVVKCLCGHDGVSHDSQRKWCKVDFCSCSQWFESRQIVVYRDTGKVLEEECEFGDKHAIRYYEPVTLSVTRETHLYDNGYTSAHQKVWKNEETGLHYYERPPIDYHGRTSYAPLGILNRGSTLGQVYDRFARDLLGKPLTKQTPYGPSFEDAFREEIEKLDAERAEYERLRTKFEGKEAK